MRKSKIYVHQVPFDFCGKARLRNYLVGIFPYLETGSAVKKAIQKKQVNLNEEIGHNGDWVSAGDRISYEFSYIKKDNTYKEFNFETFYDDNDLVILRKPPGIASSGNTQSLQSLLENYEILDEDGSLPYPFLIHRLDRGTEGLMIATKNIMARRVLGVMMDKHDIIKRYILIVKGRFPAYIKWITEPIDAKSAKTEILDTAYLDTKDPTSRIIVQLHTGRTHQIRRHFNQLGYPIIGDQQYNEDGLTFGTGLLLCAHYLEFNQPNTGKKIKIEYPIPTKIKKYKEMSSEK